MTPLTIKDRIFDNFQKSSISYGTRFPQPKYQILRWKTVTGSLKPNIYIRLYKEKNRKMSIKSITMRILENKKKYSGGVSIN